MTETAPAPAPSAHPSDADRPAIVWFRDDLRLADHPALAAAVASGRPVLCLFVLDELSPGMRPLGGAARWWLHHSLAALADALAARGGRLVLRRGPAAEVIADLAAATGAASVGWNRRYGAAEIAVDAGLKRVLRAAGIEASSFAANVLVEPPALKTAAGGPFRVFTPFWRAACGLGTPRLPLPAPERIRRPAADIVSEPLDTFALLPTRPDWAQGLRAAWTPGEAGATARLDAFLAGALATYADDRDRPDLASTSRLSPHLRFGEISPFRIWHAVEAAVARGAIERRHAEKFLSEIGWREFAFHLMFHFPELATANFQPRFDAFPWRDDPAFLTAWRRGRTGYPIVDAGSRELWATGWMHNRVRMIAASFLVKHGLRHWRDGEAWFWDTLVDACPANNAAGWQWVAGSGADAAPYFRIFNPVKQAESFDPDGAYIRHWLPELARLAPPHVHAPWTAPAAVLAAAGVRLGDTYPRPIVDHAAARDRALAAFATVKATG